MKSQLTTKRGDKGQTTALSGDAFSKAHPIMECVGTLDELRAHTAMVRLRILEEKPEDYEALSEFLLWLLHMYFLMGSACSDPLNKHPEYRRRNLSPQDLDKLEAEQQRIEAQTPLPGAFIVSASNALAAQVDIACTVARRLERSIVWLKENVPDFDSDDLMAFANRLSDYLYILARSLEHPAHQPVDYDIIDKKE